MHYWLDHHFVADLILPDRLTFCIWEKYSEGKGCEYRVLI